MGTHQNNTKPKRKSTAPERVSALPWEAIDAEGERADWGEIAEELIADVVQVVCSRGHSVQFTVTRDGGALGVRVYDEQMPKKTVWAHGIEDVNDMLEKIVNHYSATTAQKD